MLEHDDVISSKVWRINKHVSVLRIRNRMTDDGEPDVFFVEPLLPTFLRAAATTGCSSTPACVVVVDPGHFSGEDMWIIAGVVRTNWPESSMPIVVIVPFEDSYPQACQSQDGRETSSVRCSKNPQWGRVWVVVRREHCVGCTGCKVWRGRTGINLARTQIYRQERLSTFIRCSRQRLQAWETRFGCIPASMG